MAGERSCNKLIKIMNNLTKIFLNAIHLYQFKFVQKLIFHPADLEKVLSVQVCVCGINHAKAFLINIKFMYFRGSNLAEHTQSYK